MVYSNRWHSCRQCLFSLLRHGCHQFEHIVLGISVDFFVTSISQGLLKIQRSCRGQTRHEPTPNFLRGGNINSIAQCVTSNRTVNFFVILGKFVLCSINCRNRMLLYLFYFRKCYKFSLAHCEQQIFQKVANISVP